MGAKGRFPTIIRIKQACQLRTRVERGLAWIRFQQMPVGLRGTVRPGSKLFRKRDAGLVFKGTHRHRTVQHHCDGLP